MIDELRSGLRPVQAAAWVLFSDKSKYKKEVTLEREETFDFLTGNDEIKSLPTKKVKLEWNLFEFAFIVNFIPSW